MILQHRSGHEANVNSHVAISCVLHPCHLDPDSPAGTQAIVEAPFDTLTGSRRSPAGGRVSPEDVVNPYCITIHNRRLREKVTLEGKRGRKQPSDKVVTAIEEMGSPALGVPCIRQQPSRALVERPVFGFPFKNAFPAALLVVGVGPPDVVSPAWALTP